MVLGDDSKSSGQLPSLPDLPGMAGLGRGEAQAKQTGVNLKPEFSGKDEPGEKDLSVVVDLPGARIAHGADAARAVPAAEESDPYLGRLFGNYELVTKVGQGGMGLVYKGRQVSLDRVVAVKILNKALCDNAEFIKRFEREAKSVARINHPNIMAVYDFGQTDGLYYMVTEFIEGSSLSKQIIDRVMMPVEDLAPLIVQCLAGLAHVGTNGIVHRDIKPDNILITRDGIAKIADFGLAKDVSGNDHTDLTTVGLAMGTPAYMSPEQCMGRKLDGRSDIYSLGVTAYLALTGEKPFTGQSSFEIMTKQREFNPPPPRQLNPNIPKEVSDLVMRMLAKNPQDRFRDGEECRQAWMEAGQRLGFLRSQNLGNDSVMLGPERAKAARTSAVMPIPPSAMAVASPVSPPEAMSSMPKPMPEPIRAQAMDPSKNKSRLSGEFQAPPSEPEPKARSTTEKRLSSRASAATGEAFTCPRCGMLNRSDQVNCSRCNHELHDSANDPLAAKGQEAEAQRLLANGQYRDAAAVYARLADRENDRRARAILRTKEREARTLEHKNQVSEIQSLTQGLLNRGDLKGGIELLERGLRDVRDAGASSTGAETKLMEEIGSLRTRLRHRRQLRTALIVVVIAALVAGAVLVKFYLASQGTTVLPSAGSTPAAPSH